MARWPSWDAALRAASVRLRLPRPGFPSCSVDHAPRVDGKPAFRTRASDWTSAKRSDRMTQVILRVSKLVLLPALPPCAEVRDPSLGSGPDSPGSGPPGLYFEGFRADVERSIRESATANGPLPTVPV